MTTSPNPMDDKELLELAAKAAGLLNPRFHLATGKPYDAGTCILHDTHNFSQTYSWNPLTDDGDALRLAVKLRLDIQINSDDVTAISADVDGWVCELVIDEDIGAATRRAIVRAAAGIARQESSHDS